MNDWLISDEIDSCILPSLKKSEWTGELADFEASIQLMLLRTRKSSSLNF